MTQDQLTRLRLHAQQLVDSAYAAPGEVVSWLCAVQAQDYFGSLWSIGQRIKGTVTESVIEKAVADKQIVRSWPMRGTLHFVSPRDLRWMLKYLTPRVFARMAGMLRKKGIDKKVLQKSKKLWIAALEGGHQLTRDELYRLLEKKNISTDESRGLHILGCLAQEGVICFTPRRGKQQTLGLLDEWLPPFRIPEKAEALTMLAERYFTSHGPATVEDFAWWAGLTKIEATAALDGAQSKLATEKIGNTEYFFGPDGDPTKKLPPSAWLLPTYDEYGIAYKDRTAILDPRDHKMTQSPFTSMIVFRGRAIGLWRRTLENDKVRIEPQPFKKIDYEQRRAIEKEAQRYSRFVEKSLAPLEFR